MKHFILMTVVLTGACAGEYGGFADFGAPAADDADEASSSEEISEVSAAAVVSCSAPNSEGKPCNDGLFCTVEDRCHAGVCIGEERPCGGVVGFCEVATCNEATDSCVASPRGGGCVDRCDTPKLTKFYQKGWKQGFEVVSKNWDRRGQNCNRTEQFVELIVDRLARAQRLADGEANAKPKRRCRAAGVIDGAFAALDVVQSTCDQTCWLDGELVGKMAAACYCEVAIGTDGPLQVEEWLRGPLNMCGFNYEVACDSTFIGESVSYSNDAGACEPFTEGVYEQSWDRSRDKSCDYQNSNPQ